MASNTEDQVLEYNIFTLEKELLSLMEEAELYSSIEPRRGSVSSESSGFGSEEEETSPPSLYSQMLKTPNSLSELVRKPSQLKPYRYLNDEKPQPKKIKSSRSKKDPTIPQIVREILKRQSLPFCLFCFNREEEVYSSHDTRSANGKVQCPQLQKVMCRICKATGEDAHTAKYCPLKDKTNA